MNNRYWQPLIQDNPVGDIIAAVMWQADQLASQLIQLFQGVM